MEINVLKLNPNKLTIGRRNLKTSLAAGICILLFRLLQRGSPMLACLATVFALREDSARSFHFGIRRVGATLLAAILALSLVYTKQVTGWTFSVDLFGVMIAIVLFIMLCNFLDLSPAIVGGMAAFFVIYFNTASHESFLYASQRVLDTFIGSLVAIGVNLVFPPKGLKKIENP